MTNKKNIIFKDSNMIIEGNTIKWEYHTIRISSVSHIWLGSYPKECFPLHCSLVLFFIALSGSNPLSTIAMLLALLLYLASWLCRHRNQKGKKYIHLQNDSGKVYSFISTNEGFIQKAYELISGCIAKNNLDLNLQISFEGDGKIIDESVRKEFKEESKVLNIPPDRENALLINDLKKLSMSLSEKNEENKEVLSLIEETIRLSSINDLTEKKKFLSKFVTMGLINDCNKLGLSTLIDAIRTSLM